MSTVITWLLLGLIRLYQLILSPFIGYHCRFRPTCSAYAQDALTAYGPWKGSWLTLRRLIRCHPWGGHGFDPVPERPLDRVDFKSKVGSKDAAHNAKTPH